MTSGAIPSMLIVVEKISKIYNNKVFKIKEKVPAENIIKGKNTIFNKGLTSTFSSAKIRLILARSTKFPEIVNPVIRWFAIKNAKKLARLRNINFEIIFILN